MSKREQNFPSIRALSFALRNKETWPPGFKWDYKYCEQCAMGLALLMWPQHIATPTTEAVTHALGMKHGDGARIFTQMGGMMSMGHYGPTPEQVADALDEVEQLEMA